jgi:hypothetical protein
MITDRWHKALAAAFPVRGYYLEHYRRDADDDADFDEHHFGLWKMGDSIEVVLCTPRETRGIYEVDGTHKVLVRRAVPGANWPKLPRHSSSVRCYDREEILAQALRTALSKGLVADVDPKRMQAEIDKFFAASPMLRQVDPWNELDIQMTRDTVHIEVGTRSINPRDRLLGDWHGKIDLLTTPQGGRVLQTCQMARDAGINSDGRLTTGKSLFSPAMEACLLFPESTRANRLLAARSALQHREVLVDSEQPWVAHHKYRDLMLSGRHLLTAIMSHPEGYEDCVVLSPEAAAKLECYVFKIYRVADVLDVSPVVQMGQRVREGDALIRRVTREGEDLVTLSDPVFTEVFSTESCRSRVAGKPGTKAKVTVFGTLKTVDGSKIITRHGNKGIVVIRDLPRTKDGRQIDAIIHPRSVFNRRCMGVLREMALNRKCQDSGTGLRVKHIDTEHGLEDLETEGWLDYTPLENGGEALIAPLYWLRVDKHAQDALSWMAGEKPEDFRGLVPDTGKRGGQRFGHDMATVLKAKGMADVARALLEQNREPGAVSLVSRLTSALLHKEEDNAEGHH